MFMLMQCNIVTLHAPDHVVMEPHANTLCANLLINLLNLCLRGFYPYILSDGGSTKARSLNKHR